MSSSRSKAATNRTWVPRGAANPYTPLAWTPVDPMKIWHIIYSASDVATMQQIVELSKTRSAGYVYVTDDVLANPYDTVPAAEYWAAEQAITSRLPERDPARPVARQRLDTVEVFGTSVVLDWEGSRERTAPVVAYDVYRDGVMIGSAPGDG